MRKAERLFKLLGDNESKESVDYVLESARQVLATNAGVSVEQFNRALAIVVYQGYFGCGGQDDDDMCFDEAINILKRSTNGEWPNDYPFFTSDSAWDMEDEDGNPLPNAVIDGQDQLEYIFSGYKEIYGCLP